MTVDAATWVTESLPKIGYPGVSRGHVLKTIGEGVTQPLQAAITGLLKGRATPEHQARMRRHVELALKLNPQQSATPAPERSKFGEKAQCYNSANVVQIHQARTRDNINTVKLEATRIVNGRAQWDEKLVIQVTRRHLPLVAAVFLGELPEFSANCYGDENDKRFWLATKSNGVMFGAEQEGREKISVFIDSEEIFWFTQLIVRQLLNNMPGLDLMGLRHLLRVQAKKHQGGSPSGRSN